jgi:hypothetical protein
MADFFNTTPKYLKGYSYPERIRVLKLKDTNIGKKHFPVVRQLRIEGIVISLVPPSIETRLLRDLA